MDRKRIVLADDHQELLQEIRQLLTPEFQVLRTVSDGLELLAAVRACKPDAVVSDIRMPGLNGLEACRQIVHEGLCGAAILLTMYDDGQLVTKAIQAGVRGYVLKIDAGGELIPALNSVLAGGTYHSSGVRRRME
ncbi:Response regulator containing a CheY-like receiver domain and an HTH DNA-binding domain (fragment) [Candidatus Sulfopaludibacter sp. SbA3]